MTGAVSQSEPSIPSWGPITGQGMDGERHRREWSRSKGIDPAVDQYLDIWSQWPVQCQVMVGVANSAVVMGTASSKMDLLDDDF